jgi:hypothetical protein
MKSTKCEKCGSIIEYKTNKPKYCHECKDAKGTKVRKRTRSKGKNNNQPFTKWKKETQMFHMLKDLFNASCIMNGYYSWLQSPKGECMQIDWFCPEYGIAYEYQGRQHYEYSTYFHKSKKAFEYLKECDELKVKLCKECGVTLIHIRYDKKLTNRYLLLKLEESNPELYRRLIDNNIINNNVD